jgi:hypothetical protein
MAGSIERGMRLLLGVAAATLLSLTAHAQTLRVVMLSDLTQ